MKKHNFKIFQTIEKFRKLYEADENMQQGDDEQQEMPEGEAPQEGEMPADAAAPPTQEAPEGADPNAQADPEAGEFISNNQKAMFAKMLIDALMSEPPAPNAIPKEWMNATTDNADEIIKYVQNLNALEKPLSLDNENDTNTMAGALKDM